MRAGFSGADLGSRRHRVGDRVQGQKTDAVCQRQLDWCHWAGAGVAARQPGGGTARGGTAGLPATVHAGRDYDNLAGAVVAYAEVTWASCSPCRVVFGKPDGNPIDTSCTGFSPAAWQDVTQITGVSWFAIWRPSELCRRDYAWPALLQGLPQQGSRALPEYRAGTLAAVVD